MKNDPPSEQPLLLRVAEVARMMGLGSSKVRALVATGELSAIRIGRCLRVPRQAVDRFLATARPATDPQTRRAP